MTLVQSKLQLSKYNQIKNYIKNVFKFNVISKLSTMTLDKKIKNVCFLKISLFSLSNLWVPKLGHYNYIYTKESLHKLYSVQCTNTIFFHVLPSWRAFPTTTQPIFGGEACILYIVCTHNFLPQMNNKRVQIKLAGYK